MWYNTSRDCRKKRDKWKGVLICRSVKNAGQSSGLCITQIYGEYVNQYIKNKVRFLHHENIKVKKTKLSLWMPQRCIWGVEVYLPSLVTFTLYMGE